MSTILVSPRGLGYDVTIDGRMFHVEPGEPLHKMAADLLRLRRLSGQERIQFSEYTLEQLEATIAEGRGDEDIEREVARRKGVLYYPSNPDRRNIK